MNTQTKHSQRNTRTQSPLAAAWRLLLRSSATILNVITLERDPVTIAGSAGSIPSPAWSLAKVDTMSHYFQG